MQPSQPHHGENGYFRVCMPNEPVFACAMEARDNNAILAVKDHCFVIMGKLVEGWKPVNVLLPEDRA